MRLCLYSALKYETCLINTSNNMDLSNGQKTNFNVWHQLPSMPPVTRIPKHVYKYSGTKLIPKLTYVHCKGQKGNQKFAILQQMIILNVKFNNTKPYTYVICTFSADSPETNFCAKIHFKFH